MANENTICVSALMEMMKGNHALGTSAVARTGKDTLKAALYLATASKTRSTTVYDTTGEVQTGGGTVGYSAGGITITNATEPNFTITPDVAFWTPSASFVYGPTFTLPVAFDAVLIYNSSASSKAISVHIFGSQTVTAGTFTLTMPVNDGNTGLIRFARV